MVNRSKVLSMGNGDGAIDLMSSFVESHSFRKGREKNGPPMPGGWNSHFLHLAVGIPTSRKGGEKWGIPLVVLLTWGLTILYYGAGLAGAQ